MKNDGLPKRRYASQTFAVFRQPARPIEDQR